MQPLSKVANNKCIQPTQGQELGVIKDVTNYLGRFLILNSLILRVYAYLHHNGRMQKTVLQLFFTLYYTVVSPDLL